jgi:hypothetical protein
MPKGEERGSQRRPSRFWKKLRPWFGEACFALCDHVGMPKNRTRIGRANPAFQNVRETVFGVGFLWSLGRGSKLAHSKGEVSPQKDAENPCSTKNRQSSIVNRQS